MPNSTESEFFCPGHIIGSIKSARGRRIWTIKSTLVNAVLRGNGAILLHYNSFAPPLPASSAQPAQPATGPLGQ